eukprot:3916366-Alexandrium_andersonii.AAC.1
MFCRLSVCSAKLLLKRSTTMCMPQIEPHLCHARASRRCSSVLGTEGLWSASGLGPRSVRVS